MQQLTIKSRRRSSVMYVMIVISLQLVSGCSDSADEDDIAVGNWSKTTPFKGRPRSGAIAFTIDSRAYVGLGYDGDDYIADFYVFNIATGYWESRKAFPGILRERAVSFSANGKGYVGLGYNREEDKEELGDFWEYDPLADTWTQLSNFGGTARFNAVAFSIGSKGYVGTGYDGDEYNSDFWEYDIASNSWKEIVSFPGEKIESGFSFVINGKGYVAGGRNNGLYNTGFWEFDPEALTWTSRSPASDDSDYDEFILGVQRHDAVAIVAGSKAYIVGGYGSSGAVTSNVEEFNAESYSWQARTAFEGSSRSSAIGFVLDNRLFFGTGQNGTSRYDDIWEFKPSEEYDSSY